MFEKVHMQMHLHLNQSDWSECADSFSVTTALTAVQLYKGLYIIPALVIIHHGFYGNSSIPGLVPVSAKAVTFGFRTSSE